MVFNVYQKNDQYQKLINKVLEENPDLLLLLEIDKKWNDALRPLHQKYPYKVEEVKSNTYGMMLFSKLAPIEKKVEYRTDDKVPSINLLTECEHRSLRILGLHPLAPIPGEADTTQQKDAEFHSVAKYISGLPDDQLVIVMGDLNDVVWSKASKSFKKISGLKDPRVGRGTFSTFPTYFPVRFPLDHIFCSHSLKLGELRRLPDIGSDHYPMYFTFSMPSVEQ